MANKGCEIKGAEAAWGRCLFEERRYDGAPAAHVSSLLTGCGEEAATPRKPRRHSRASGCWPLPGTGPPRK